jgi:hypothetical protein
MDDLNRPLKSPKTDLPLLPELEPLEATITEVEFKTDEFKGKTVYLTNDNKETILDGDGNPIPRKIFNVTVSYKSHLLSNGTARKSWLKLGASMNEKAKLPKLIDALKIKISDNPTPKEIIDALKGFQVKLQLKNNEGNDGKVYQNIIFDTIRPAVVLEKEISWEP